ncbi:hypothetical protein MAR_009021 [Mya arenaria]|uniref:EGF-like domain-containing protein n=1 Tax=Mya arenaria TaxID=6604 RepID=A0ABY7DXK6_MYAAR|nr:hypothetical protein MAR_009021 [Mya arenaria]
MDPYNISDLGGVCVTDNDCDSGLCDTTRTTSICALGDADSCAAPYADKCVLNAECTTNTCTCKTGFTATNKLCIGVALGDACTNVAPCTAANSVCGGADNSKICSCADGYTKETTFCKAELGVACATNADCGIGVCDSTRSSSICALGHAESCASPNTGKCVLNAECTTNTCTCKSDFTATNKLCIGAFGSECETSTGCGGSDICDTNANPATCALVSGGTCDAAKSQCMTYSECTTEGCTCSNGDADETTNLCPSPNSGFREISSMLAVVTCIWLSQL